MQLRPFKDLIGLSEEELDKQMVPIRAKQVKSQAQLEMAKIEGDILTKETQVQEMFTKKGDINFSFLMDKLDDIALLERRKEQYEEVLNQLFPAESA